MPVILGVPGAFGGPPDTPPPTYQPPGIPSFGGFALTSSRGSVQLQGGYEAIEGWTGLGPTERKVNRRRPLGINGAVVDRQRPTTRSERVMEGPVHVEAPSAVERARLARHLLDVLSPLDESPVTFSARVDTGEVVTGECWAEFSGDDEWQARAAWDLTATLGLRLVFPDFRLFGQRRAARQGGSSGAVPFFPLLPLVISESSSFGQPFRLDVGGDLAVHAVWTWTGPGTKLVVSNAAGRSWGLDLTAAPLLAGQKVVVTTDPRAATLGQKRLLGPGGVDYYRYLTPRSLFPLAPGQDTVTLDVLGDGVGTEVLVEWRPATEAIL